jgi:hypothetical protein
MKTMTWKTKLIIAAIVVALVLAGCGIVSAMSFGSLLLALVSLAVGSGCGWYAKHIYDKYFKDK